MLTKITLVLTIAQQLVALPNCDLRKIFQTPPKRNYDDFGILERSNFDPTPTSEPQTSLDKVANLSEQPLLANAQVVVRFGDNCNSNVEKNDNNNNNNNNNKYCPPRIIPVYVQYPPPNYYNNIVGPAPGPGSVIQVIPQPHQPRPQQPCFQDPPKKSLIPTFDLKECAQRPKIIDEIKIEEIQTKDELVKFNTDDQKKLETTNVKLVNLNLDQLTKPGCQVRTVPQQSLVPYIFPNGLDARLLLQYPIFKEPGDNNLIGTAGNFIVKQEGGRKYLCIPLDQGPAPGTCDGCQKINGGCGSRCPYCSKYTGELSELTLLPVSN